MEAESKLSSDRHQYRNRLFDWRRLQKRQSGFRGSLFIAVVIDLIDWPHEPPWGAEEPTTAVVPSAISNAVFDATGARLRSVPFTPDKVLAALATV